MSRPSSFQKYLFKSILFITLFSTNTTAVKRTVDADGGSSYPTVYQALGAAQSGDTIWIQGADIDTYNENFSTDNLQANITIMGAQTNPDSFPILSIKGNYWYTWWDHYDGTTRFERVRLSDCHTIPLGNRGRILYINKSIIEKCTTSTVLFSITGNRNQFLRITNTLFRDNKKPIFSDITAYNSSNINYGCAINCTFFNNTLINADASYPSTDPNHSNHIIDFENCIFWGNTTICSSPSLLSRYDYCLVPNKTGWGANCIDTTDPCFMLSSPVKPSDFRIKKSSAARNKAHTTVDANLVPAALLTYDIFGASRTATPGYDIGAFEWVDSNVPPDLISITSASVNENLPSGSFVGKLSTLDQNVNDAFTYRIIAGPDSAFFRISHDSLKTRASFNYEAKSSYRIRLRSTDLEGMYVDSNFTISVINVNDTIIQLNLTGTSIAENNNIKSMIGKLSSIDGDSGSAFTYELAGGDSSSFQISHDTLFSKQVFNYESDSTFTVMIRTIDGGVVGGDTLSRNFSIKITNANEPPTAIVLNGSIVIENNGIHSVVGYFRTTDPDIGSRFTYTLSTGSGDIDNVSFLVSDSTLFIEVPADYETDSLYSIRVKTTDNGTPVLSLEQTFSIRVTNGPDSPTNIIISKDSLMDGAPAGEFIGKLSATDQDIGDIFSYTLGTTEDDTLFLISNDSLKTKQSLSYQMKPAYSTNITVHDATGLTYLKKFTIYIKGKPFITLNPKDTIVAENTTFTLYAGVTGTAPFSYQWLNSNGDTVGSNAILTIANVTKAMSGIQYRCIITNSYGTITSNPAKLTVYQVPAITAQPLSDTAITGTDVTVSIQATGDSLSYFWIRNVSDTIWRNATLLLANIKESDSGSYRCIVSNAVGSVSSAAISLRVLVPPTFLIQPLDVKTKDGDSATFSVSVTGTSPFTYKWLKNGTDSVGAQPSYFIPQATLSDDSSFYVCVVKNEARADTSQKASLYVSMAPPIILKEPSDTAVVEGATVIFNVKISGTAPFKYTWYKSNSSVSLNSDSATLILSGIKASEDSSTYTCMIENGAGKIFSRAALLRVGTIAPKIKVHPVSTTSYIDQSVIFTVEASGTSPLHYSWFKAGQPNSAVGTDSSVFTIENVELSSEGTYFCIIRNSAGVDTSKSVVLTVRNALEKPTIVTSPQSLTRYFSETATFSVIAFGNPEPKYQWIINGEKAVGKTANTLSISNLNSSYDNAKIVCKVYNDLDTLYSDTAILTILPPPEADFSVNVETGTIPLTVTFTDKSKQSIDSYFWDFGDGTISTLSNPVHIYSTEGLFAVKLIVKGPSGIDTMIKDSYIYAFAAGSNPVRVSYVYLEGSMVILNLLHTTHIDTLSLQKFDTLDIYTAKDVIPLQTTGAIKAGSYNVKNIMNSAGIFTDTLVLPGNPGEQYGIMTFLRRVDGTKTSASTANGVMVLLKDTIPPLNPLTISGTHLGADSSSFSVSNIIAIDTAKVDSVAICYSTDTNSLSYENSWSQRLSVQQLKAGTGNLFTIVLHNEIFSTGSRKIWCSVIVKGKNGSLSNRVLSYFTTQNSTVTNPVVLHADAISSSKIRVSWPPLSDSLISKVRIWKSTTEIEPGNDIPPGFESITLLDRKNSYIFEQLQPSTQYYFGVQVFKNGMWSPFSKEATSGAKTLAATDAPLVINTITVKEPMFDTLTSRIMLSWCLDSSVADNQYVGITYSTKEYPTFPLPIQKIKSTASCNSATVELHEQIHFNTTYFFALWVSNNENGPWTDPVASSKISYTTPAFKRELVSYFNPLKNKDTVTAFNGSVVLFTDQKFEAISTDTIIVYKDTTLPGVLPVGTGFYFGKKEQSPAFNIGLRYDSIPVGYTADNIKMYRVKGKDLYVEHDAKQDKTSKMIYTTTKDLDYPFVLLIDTMIPAVTVNSKTDSVVVSTKDILDTVTVKDNICNLRWEYLTGRGDESGSSSDSGFASKTTQAIYLHILSKNNKISTESGIRANFHVTDGNNHTFTNLSRKVRSNEIKFPSVAMRWTPMAANKEMDNTSTKYLIDKYPKDSSSLAYDTRYIRLYSWEKKNKSALTKEWIEYTDSTSAFFKFTPGKVYWVKTLTDFTFEMGGGVTLSLKDTQTIVLEPNEFTDLGVPFAFDITLSDIFKATGPGMADSLSVYSWVDTNKNYIIKPYYLHLRTTNQDVLVCKKGNSKQQFYSILNLTPHPVTLRIPPTPVTLSSGVAAKKTSKESWFTKISCIEEKTGSYSEMYCGYRSGEPSERYFPAPPTLHKNRAMIFNRNDKKFYGNYLSGQCNDGIYQTIAFENKESFPVTFSYNLENEGVFPDGVTASLLDSKTGIWSVQGKVTVEPNSVEYRWAVIGNDNFRQNFHNKVLLSRYMLHPIFPNPVRSSAAIRYSVPFGANENLRFAIYDMLGRVVWNRDIGEMHMTNEQILYWNCVDKKGNKINSGLYIVKLSVLDKQGKILKTFDTRLTYLR